jgi:hypothetical protein
MTTPATQRHEIEAWLGDGHDLTGDQLDNLVRVADDINARWPDQDDVDEREAALVAAYQLLSASDTDTVLARMAGHLRGARAEERRALAAIQQAAHMLIGSGQDTQAGFARKVGVDRMAVREWLGLRDRGASGTT